MYLLQVTIIVSSTRVLPRSFENKQTEEKHHEWTIVSDGFLSLFEIARKPIVTDVEKWSWSCLHITYFQVDANDIKIFRNATEHTLDEILLKLKHVIWITPSVWDKDRREIEGTEIDGRMFNTLSWKWNALQDG